MEKLSSDITLKNYVESSFLTPLQIIVIDKIHGKVLCDEYPLFQDLLRVMVDTKLRRDDKLVLGFRDHKKVEVIPNVAISLIITPNIGNHTIYEILIDDGSSCNVLYVEALMKLGLHQPGRDLCTT